MIQINRKDILWNYAATFLKIAAAALLLPLILRLMPSEMVGIWTVFMTITAFTSLLDFGFNPSFTRNVTYIFSGVNNLKAQGVEIVITGTHIDYGLLKGVISAMRWIYLRMSIILFLVLTTLGTWYIFSLLQNYKGNPKEVYIAWFILCTINTYNLYSLYYESLLQGKGLIKRSKQIVIIGQSVYLGIAIILIMLGFGLIAIVSAQASSVIIVRWLSFRAFFTREINQKLLETESRHKVEVLKAIYPNALKIGLTSLGGFMVQRSALIIGSLYLSLEEIASYGITMQLIAVIGGLAGIYTATYQPKISQFRVERNNLAIKELYLKGQIILILTYILGGVSLLVLGQWGLGIINSKTQLMSNGLILLALILSLEQSNLSIAGGILLSKNEVPFFKAAIISGLSIVIVLFIFFQLFHWGLLIMLIVPFIVDVSYQAWKWPMEVIKELEIINKDLYKIITIIIRK
ncbi:MAG: O-unit flippase-like protein [Mariniphaga sp.]